MEKRACNSPCRAVAHAAAPGIAWSCNLPSDSPETVMQCQVLQPTATAIAPFSSLGSGSVLGRWCKQCACPILACWWSQMRHPWPAAFSLRSSPGTRCCVRHLACPHFTGFALALIHLMKSRTLSSSSLTNTQTMSQSLMPVRTGFFRGRSCCFAR